MPSPEDTFKRAMDELRPYINGAMGRFVAATDQGDVKAEIYASIWTAVQRFEGRSSLKTYLYPVISRRIADYFRSRYRENKVLRQAQEAYKEKTDDLMRPESEYQEPVLLSPAELRVFRCLADGISNEEICEALHLSLNTVRSHIKSLYKKTKAPNRARLTLLANRFWKGDKT